MSVWQPIKRLLSRIPRAIQSMSFMVARFSDFVVWGGIRVETPLRFRSQANGEIAEAFFRTTIQLDGDIINILPDPYPEPYKNDPSWLRIYEERSRLHWERIGRLLIQSDQITRSVTWIVNALAGLLSAYILLFRYGTIPLAGYAEPRWLGIGIGLVAVIGLIAVVRVFLPGWLLKLVFFLMKRKISVM